ncbi:hypothetical protein JXB28_05495 [Candidatus Woesearchaeota archaeon]|nr:hypothetical protein [Candidatus Woesearchaeota archaeon]
MATQKHSGGGSTRRMVITKEFLIGLLAIVIGGYNLYYLYTHKTPIIKLDVTHSVADIILVIAGLILWITAYKLWRFKWHSRGLF